VRVVGRRLVVRASRVLPAVTHLADGDLTNAAQNR